MKTNFKYFLLSLSLASLLGVGGCKFQQSGNAEGYEGNREVTSTDPNHNAPFDLDFEYDFDICEMGNPEITHVSIDPLSQEFVLEGCNEFTEGEYTSYVLPLTKPFGFDLVGIDDRIVSLAPDIQIRAWCYYAGLEKDEDLFIYTDKFNSMTRLLRVSKLHQSSEIITVNFTVNGSQKFQDNNIYSFNQSSTLITFNSHSGVIFEDQNRTQIQMKCLYGEEKNMIAPMPGPLPPPQNDPENNLIL